MKRSIWFSTLALVALVLTVAGCSDQQNFVTPQEQQSSSFAPLFKAEGSQKVPDSYIVVLRQSVSNVPDVANEMAKTHGLALGHTYKTALKGYSAHIPAGRLNALRSDPRVDYIEPDQVVSLGPAANGKPGSAPQPQVTPWGITRVGGFGDGTGTTAWIIDTGIDLANADLNVDVARSKNFVLRGQNSPNDGNGHGTHVSGTIAAKNNTIDVIGVAANAKVVAVRVLDNSGSGQYSWVIAGVDYVASAGAAGDAANMSLGGPLSATLDQAVINAAATGVKFAIAAGNSGANANNYSPARVNGANIVTVSAINASDVFASFSNFGNPPIDWAAPGVSVLSLKRGGGTTTLSGTSMATPHVTGLLLLGTIQANGTAFGDPDGNPDSIAHR